MKHYFIRLNHKFVNAFEVFTAAKNLSVVRVSYDYINGEYTMLYSVVMDTYSAVELKLSIPVTGCMTFNKIAV